MYCRTLLLLACGIFGCSTAPTPPPVSPQEAELGRIQEQLEHFYGPLLFLVEESELAIEDVLFRLKRDRVFPENGELSDTDLNFWLYRAEEDLMPRNEEMLRVIKDHRHLAESDMLRSLLDDLLEHQTSWRKLHKRWKEEQIQYSWHSKTPFPRSLGQVLRDEFAKLRKRQAELFKVIPGAELAFVERQLSELYAPLVRHNREGYLAFFRLLNDLGRRSIFPMNPAKEKEELELWFLWCDEVFFPRNEQARMRIKESYFLIEGSGTPEGMLAFLDHWNSWKIQHARWTGHQVPYRWHSKRNYPRTQFSEGADVIFQALKSKQVKLRGDARYSYK